MCGLRVSHPACCANEDRTDRTQLHRQQNFDYSRSLATHAYDKFTLYRRSSDVAHILAHILAHMHTPCGHIVVACAQSPPPRRRCCPQCDSSGASAACQRTSSPVRRVSQSFRHTLHDDTPRRTVVYVYVSVFGVCHGECECACVCVQRTHTRCQTQ